MYIGYSHGPICILHIHMIKYENKGCCIASLVCLHVFSSPELKAHVSFSDCLAQLSVKIGTKHSWMNGIQVCSNEGPHPFPREDKYEIGKIH